MDDAKQREKAKTVLNYWHTMEFLAQDKYDAMWDVQKKVREVKASCRRGESREKTLWDFVELEAPADPVRIACTEAASCGMEEWGNITVYIGKIRREACIKCIAEILPEREKEERCEESFDEIAWASLQLAPDGTYMEHSLSLSTVIWAMSRIRSSKKLSECIDERQYASEVKELEAEFFGKGNGSLTEAVSGKTLGSLSQAIEKRWIRSSIDQADAAVWQENYGLYFQIFLDENTKKKREDDNYTGLSHAYFLSDLRLISEALDGDGEFDRELLHYIDILGNESEFQPVRIELVRPKKQEKPAFFRQLSELLEVKHAPLGKWPSRYMPALMQQIAVNLGMRKEKSGLFGVNGTVFSVNGPPGTGKTTLLKEIVAGNVIERAALLAEYEEPDSAFERHPFLCGEGEGGAYYKYVRYWNSLKDDRINDYGILVASCNNAAVENVTKELPVGSGICEALQPGKQDAEELGEMLDEVRKLFDAEQAEDHETIGGAAKNDIYFTEYAKGLLKNNDAWGLVAAPLGKRSNLSDFYFQVLSPLHRDFYKRNADIENRLERYQKARETFGNQLEKVRRMQEDLQEICDLAGNRLQQKRADRILQEKRMRGQAEYEAEMHRLREEIRSLEQRLAELEDQIAETLEKKETLAFQVKEKQEQAEEQSVKKREFLEREAEVRDSVGLLDRIFKKSACTAKNQLADEYHAQAEKAEAEYRRMCGEAEQIREMLTQKEAEYDSRISVKLQMEDEIRRKEKEICRQRETYETLVRQAEESAQSLEKLEASYLHTMKEFTGAGPVDSGAVLDERFADDLLSEEDMRCVRAQVTDPWFTERYNREREKLFYCAMKLNKEFVLASKRCRDNLITLAQYWGMKPDENNERISFAKQDKEAFAAALYQTLFLLVPVLSSTFASIGTFLRDIKEPRALGTLIVDEAGQAQPQMAAGALFRCRKAVIVGDPRQVEPVVTDDLNLLKKAFEDQELRPYQSKSISVQSFADKMNGFGTYLDNGTDYPEWVGCPLLVHRRCISPMYDISNEISYNGIMKQQTREPDRRKAERFVYNRSQWINVDGKERGRKDHFVEAQGRKVCEILETAFSKEADPDLFIISPFTSVVRGMKKYLRDYKNTHPDSPLFGCRTEWINRKIGTVHTFQGKEAAEVIFLLGCDKSREAAGAVRWVNANIVNVAATRAKYRLYVIGDEEVWRKSEVVNRAKDIIDTFALRQIKTIVEREMSEDERRKALTDASSALPPVTSFHTEVSENDEGEKEYSVNTEGFLKALGPEFMEGDLTREQLQSFGFSSGEMLEKLPPQIRDNLRLGIRLYFLLQAVYEVNQKLDASCCSILFCKAIELQMKECFGAGLKRILPDSRLKGKETLEKADVNRLTLGNFCHIIGKGCERLADRMAEKGEERYSVPWWHWYEERLKRCTSRRNQCCHSGLFTWEDQKLLIREIFLDEEGPEEKTGNTLGMKGLLFEAEVGKRL